MNEWLPKFKGETLLAKIVEISEGLDYVSETDAAIEPFDAGKRDAVDARYLIEKDLQKKEVREILWENFFQRLTEQRDWFDEDQKQKATRYAELEDLLRENLLELKVFKIGTIQIDIYVIGFDQERNLLGIKTKAVET